MSDITFSSDLTLSGVIKTPTYTNYHMARRPETVEDALAIIQAFWDVRGNGQGFIFSVSEDADRARMDANPMLVRDTKET